MSAYATPLRYPGGKRILFKDIADIINHNGLKSCLYIEPFAGGAGLAFQLLFQHYVKSLLLNDKDKSIYSFWASILNHTEEFCRLVNDTPVTIEEWKKQKAIQNDKDNQNIIDLGFSTFYLNRTNRSGIIKGGIIGGWDQASNYKIDCRFNKKDLVDRINRIAQNRSSVMIFNLDAEDFIRDYVSVIKEKTFLFIDPPYYKKGAQLYENHYNHEDHVRLFTTINNLRLPWIVTYDSVSEIQELYCDYRQKIYNLNYSAAKKQLGTEIMIFSNDLKIEW